MVGTLTVQNLQGPSSGANANKIIIPSGQTLDASNGMEFPSGSVVQVATDTNSANVYWSGSSSWNDVWRPLFTPKYADSTLTFTVSINVLNESSNVTDLWVGWRGLNGQYHYGFGKAGNLSGWNQMNNAITYSAPAGVAGQNPLWIQLRAGSATSYFNYNFGNGNARSTVTMWEVR